MEPAEDLDGLDTTSLIALCLGGKDADTVAAAVRLGAAVDLPALSQASAGSLRVRGGLSPARAARLAAAFALGRRVQITSLPARPSLRSADRVHEQLAPELRGLSQETFHVLLLDGKHRLLSRQRVSEGTLTSSLVHPREVFRPAVREAAAAVIVAHNHPSGDAEPSAEDLSVTRRLIEAGRILGIPVLDHVVIGDGTYVSIRDRISFEAR
jgi:DNA repair protein RadC